MTSVQHDVNDMDDAYHANRDCREDSRRGIPIAKGKIEIAIGKVIYLPANERIPSFRHQYFFFPLDFARAIRPLSVFSHFVRGTPDAAATGKKHQFLQYKSSRPDCADSRN